MSDKFNSFVNSETGESIPMSEKEQEDTELLLKLTDEMATVSSVVGRFNTWEIMGISENVNIAFISKVIETIAPDDQVSRGAFVMSLLDNDMSGLKAILNMGMAFGYQFAKEQGND